MKFEAFVASRYLRAKRKQAFIGVISTITLVGITLGVAALNIALAINNGMRQAWVRSLVGETGELHLVNRFSGDGFTEDELQTVTRVLAEMPDVEAVSHMREEPALLTSPSRRVGFTKVHGIRPSEYLATSKTLRSLEVGDTVLLERRDDADAPGIVLGYDLAARLNVQYGDFIKMTVPRLSSPGLISRREDNFRTLKVQVVGVFRTGNSQFDEFDSYIHLEALCDFLNETRIQAILVKLCHLNAFEPTKTALRQHPEVGGFTRVVDFMEINEGILHALKLEKLASTLVISLIILIVGLNMVSALTMLVMEKHRDIGIMKAMGASKRMILRIFVRQGMTLSLWGTLGGSLLGTGIAVVADSFQLIKLDNNVYEVINYLPFQVNPLEVLLVAVGSLAVAFCASIYPARQAAGLDPVEALKYE